MTGSAFKSLLGASVDHPAGLPLLLLGWAGDRPEPWFGLFR